MARRAGDLPAWAAITVSVLGVLLAAAAAWGAANMRLNAHDSEIERARAALERIDRNQSRICEALKVECK